MNLLDSRVGLAMRTALVVNDVLAMVFFALVFGVGNSWVLLLQISLFFLITIVVGFLIVQYTLKRNTKRHAPIIVLTSGLGICFLFATFEENLGLTAIIGAFIAGIFIKKTPQAGILAEYMKTIGYAFFVPMFFVWVGASFDFLSLFHSDQMTSLVLFCIVFIICAMSGNFIGSSLGARISGFKWNEARSVGIGMMPVMGVALIIVSTGIDRGFFGDPSGFLANQMKTATLFLIFASCFISPILLKRSMGSTMMRKIGKSKTKLSSYHQPVCGDCGSALHLLPERNIWYCDLCEKVVIPTKKTTIRRLTTTGVSDKQLGYIIGAVTIIICALTIQNNGSSFIEKIPALVGTFIGTTIGYLTVKHFFIKQHV